MGQVRAASEWDHPWFRSEEVCHVCGALRRSAGPDLQIRQENPQDGDLQHQGQHQGAPAGAHASHRELPAAAAAEGWFPPCPVERPLLPPQVLNGFLAKADGKDKLTALIQVSGGRHIDTTEFCLRLE